MSPIVRHAQGEVTLLVPGMPFVDLTEGFIEKDLLCLGRRNAVLEL
jgi:hypothetical protein